MFFGILQSVITLIVVAPPSGDFFTSVDYFSFEKTSFDFRYVYTGDFAVRFRNAFLLVKAQCTVVIYKCSLYARLFVPGKLYKLGLMLVGRAKSLL
jgi:hypothetical protein